MGSFRRRARDARILSRRDCGAGRWVVGAGCDSAGELGVAVNYIQWLQIRLIQVDKRNDIYSLVADVWDAAIEEAAKLHENIKLSEDSRNEMRVIIKYRDEIRALKSSE